MLADMVESMASHRMSGLEWGLLLLLAGLWGGSFLFNELALRELAPFSVVAWRVGVGAAALWLVIAVGGIKVPTAPSVWLGFAVLGVLNNAIPFFLIVWGQARIDSGLAAILNSTTPLFALVLAHFLTADERITGSRALGLGLGICGVVVLVGPNALTGLTGAWLGQMAMLGAALSYAAAGVFGRRLKETPPVVLAAGMLTAAAVVAVPAALVADGWVMPRSVEVWGALFGLAVPGGAIAYLIYFRVLASAGATNLLLVTLLIPFAALLLGAVVLGEVVTPEMVGGLVLVLGGLAVIDGRAVVFARRRIARRRA